MSTSIQRARVPGRPGVEACNARPRVPEKRHRAEVRSRSAAASEGYASRSWVVCRAAQVVGISGERVMGPDAIRDGWGNANTRLRPPGRGLAWPAMSFMPITTDRATRPHFARSATAVGVTVLVTPGLFGGLSMTLLVLVPYVGGRELAAGACRRPLPWSGLDRRSDDVLHLLRRSPCAACCWGVIEGMRRGRLAHPLVSPRSGGGLVRAARADGACSGVRRPHPSMRAGCPAWARLAPCACRPWPASAGSAGVLGAALGGTCRIGPVGDQWLHGRGGELRAGRRPRPAGAPPLPATPMMLVHRSRWPSRSSRGQPGAAGWVTLLVGNAPAAHRPARRHAVRDR
jgi:hypothetical protein